MDEKIEYVSRISVYHEQDFFVLEGMNYDGIFYTGGKMSTGEIINDQVFDLRNERFDFGEFGRFDFSFSSVREVRRNEVIDKLEKKTGVDYSHIEEIIAMPWERIWNVVNEKRDKLRLRRVA